MTASPPTVTREAGTSRSVRRTPRRRLSGAHLLIGLVVVMAFVLNYLALQDRGEATRVAVADRPLAAGSRLSASDLRFVPIDSDFEAIDSLLTQALAPGYEGWIIGVNVAEAELVRPTALIDPGAPAGLRSMSIPVPVEHAAGGTISPGDRIDVVSVEEGEASFVVVDVEVLGVADSDEGALGRLGEYHVVVAVDDRQALALAEAIDSDSLEVIRSTGSRPSPRGSDGS